MSINYSQVLFDNNIADDYGRELLKNGITEAKAGNKDLPGGISTALLT